MQKITLYAKRVNTGEDHMRWQLHAMILARRSVELNRTLNASFYF